MRRGAVLAVVAVCVIGLFLLLRRPNAIQEGGIADLRTFNFGQSENPTPNSQPQAYQEEPKIHITAVSEVDDVTQRVGMSQPPQITTTIIPPKSAKTTITLHKTITTQTHHNPIGSSKALPSAQPPINVTRNESHPPSVRPTVPSPVPIPFMGNYNCSNAHCTEFLTEQDRMKTTRCGNRNQSPQNSQFPGKCHFMNGRGRSTTFLMSYPGSGNTWVRGLLEQATGICTGAVYCDGNLKNGGFNGENLSGGTVLATKSHSAMWPPRSQSGILLVRNPLDAYISEWNRQHSGGHVGQANRALFGTNPQWDRFTQRFSMSPWISFFKWLVKGHQTGRQVLVVRYEDLKSDALTQVKRMLDFLGVPYSDEALQKRMSVDFGKFHRKHDPASDFDHYTAEQRNRITGLVRQAIEFLKSNNNGTTYGIEEYLQ